MSNVDVVTSGVKEVRLGLFRICWKHLKLTLRRRVVPTSKEIKLCGSQLGRSVLISLQVSPTKYKNQITVLMQPKDVDKGSIDGKEPSKKHRKLNESLVSEENLENLVQPLKVWIEKAVSVCPIKVSQLHNDNNSWEGFFHHDETEECSLAIWIDFGSNEVRQTHMNKQLAEMLHSQTHCDVQFQFKNGQSIGAHIVILSASSPVFAAMFKPGFKESQTRVVVIQDIDVQVFRHLLDYFYTSEAPRKTRNEESNIMLLYEAADKYDVEYLKKECIKILLRQLDTENAFEMLIWSTNHDILKLLEAALKKIVKNCKMLCSQPSWLNFMKNHPELCQEVTKKMADLVDNSSDSDSSDSEY